MSRTLVIKFGGELLESASDRSRIAAALAALVVDQPVVVVHGGGRAIDAELGRRGIAPRKVDGLRITDEATLDVVVAVLAGSANTALVASLVGCGVAAVGLTGVDAGFGRATRTAAHRATSGAVVDLGRVGDPGEPDPTLIETLLMHRYVPVIASLGIDAAAAGATPSVLNVNADVMACRLTASLGDADLVIAGATPGVFDALGAPIETLDLDGIDRLIADGSATAGMVAKLAACRAALAAGVPAVRLVDGRRMAAGTPIESLPGTTLTGARASVARTVSSPEVLSS